MAISDGYAKTNPWSFPITMMFAVTAVAKTMDMNIAPAFGERLWISPVGSKIAIRNIEETTVNENGLEPAISKTKAAAKFPTKRYVIRNKAMTFTNRKRLAVFRS